VGNKNEQNTKAFIEKDKKGGNLEFINSSLGKPQYPIEKKNKNK
jgi:hypothetical protein